MSPARLRPVATQYSKDFVGRPNALAKWGMTMTADSFDCAILAPVPQIHLESAREVSREKGYVAFGSAGKSEGVSSLQLLELFASLDGKRGPRCVPVLIYASHQDTFVNLSISWFGWYMGSVQSDEYGDHPLGIRHRPPTTVADKHRHWGIYWHVAKLVHLPKHDTPIDKLYSYATGRRLARKAPRRPMLVACPDRFPLLERCQVS